jgi:hypothetical protein
MKIFQLGYPGAMGGANTECWHTLRLWREAGWQVTMIPTWGADSHWEEKLDSIGVKTVHVDVDKLETVPGLAGSIVVGMCNQHFCRTLPQDGGPADNFARLKAMGCKTIWAPCMTFIFSHEVVTWTRHGLPDGFMFQSEFQRDRFAAAYKRYGYQPEQGHLIRGAFFADEFDFNPAKRVAGEPFVIGKLARPDADKWSAHHWQVVEAVKHPDRVAMCMGWTGKLAAKVGPPPNWAVCLAPQEVTPQEFLSQCHCLLTLNGGAAENWPRVGLEAMAAGVPIVAQNAWGWQEMIEHNVSGFLCANDSELVYWLDYLAGTEFRRREIAEAGRVRCEELSEPGAIIEGWRRLFRFVESREAVTV